jgi:hypothetical protein
MTPRELAEKIFHQFNAAYGLKLDVPPTMTGLYYSIESLLSSALEEAVVTTSANCQKDFLALKENSLAEIERAKAATYAKDDGYSLEIEGVRYSTELFKAWGEKGIEAGSLFMLEKRDDGTITIRTFKDNSAVNIAKQEAYEECAKIADENNGELHDLFEPCDCADKIRAKAAEVGK